MGPVKMYLPSPSAADCVHKGFGSAMWHGTFAALDELLRKDNRHVDRHSGHKYVMTRDREYLISVLGIEDLKASRHDFCLSRTFPESRLDLSVKRFETALRSEGKDPAQGIFDSDWSLEKREAGVHARKAGS